MATGKRLIDAMRIDFDEVDISECTDVDDIIWAVERLIDAQPIVDAVVLPKGRPGDYLEWSNGFSKKIYYIHAIIICCDGMRYDLGDFAPFVHSCNIVRIMDREEAKREINNGKTD